MKLRILPVIIFLGLIVFDSQSSYAESFPLGVIDPVIAATNQGQERLVYKVSWSGGIKIGDIQMNVAKTGKNGEYYEFKVNVKDSGLFHLVYPVNDSFTTIVDGIKRLPISYEVLQKEGKSYTARRLTDYDQQSGKIRYQKNDLAPELFEVEGEVYNEFSSFLVTRLLHLDPEHPVVVPTFADGSRHKVVVRTGKPLRFKKTILGDVNVLPVTPLMKFKGLYDKEGDTTIWLTDDECRIPVRINSKIVVGALTAELVSYSNPLCKDQSLYHKDIPASSMDKQKLELGD
jgi:hypothetical protein